jgi:hypothetical protein
LGPPRAVVIAAKIEKKSVFVPFFEMRREGPKESRETPMHKAWDSDRKLLTILLAVAAISLVASYKDVLADAAG